MEVTGVWCCCSYQKAMTFWADSRFAPSQWEMSLQSNAVSHWLGTNLESASTSSVNIKFTQIPHCVDRYKLNAEVTLVVLHILHKTGSQNEGVPWLAPGNFNEILVIDGWSISCEIAIRWMPQDLTDDKSALVQVMAWCRQATSHYLNQC